MGLIRTVLHVAWRWNNRPRRMTPAELGDLLRRMQAGEATPGEWDYFQALELSDARLEAIREKVASLYGSEFDHATDVTLATAIVRADEIARADATNGS